MVIFMLIYALSGLQNAGNQPCYLYKQNGVATTPEAAPIVGIHKHMHAHHVLHMGYC